MLKMEELSNPNSCLSKARQDEMLFVLRAHDAAAPHAIREWVKKRIELGKNFGCDTQIAEAIECASYMEQVNRRSRLQSLLYEIKTNSAGNNFVYARVNEALEIINTNTNLP